MKPSDGNQTQCPCCKECNECNTVFQKVVDLKNTGLVIYRHTTQIEDVNEDTGIIEFATKTTEDVYILHNTKNKDITSADYVPEIEQNTINCPRCRNIIEHAQKLLLKVPTINRNDVKGICEHCRNKEAPCFECEEVVKKFVARKNEQGENKKEKVKQWLSKIKDLLKDTVVDTERGQERVRAYSELYIDQLCREVPRPGRQLDVKQMFHPESVIQSDMSNCVGVFPPSIQKRNKMFAHFPQLEKLEHPVVFIDSPVKVDNLYMSKPKQSIDIADRDKVYVSDVDSDDLKVMFFAPLTEAEKQEREKYVGLRDHIPPVPFQSEADVLVRDDSTTKFEEILRPRNRFLASKQLDVDIKRFAKIETETYEGKIWQRHKTFDRRPEVIPFDFVEKHYKLDHKAELKLRHSVVSLNVKKELQGKTNESPKIIRKYHSEEALLTTITGVKENIIKQNFSYVFPTLSPDKKKLKQQKSSSELIKDTQDKLLAKAEEDNKKLEEERKKKLEEEERKKRAREEKRRQLEDKKKSDEEKKRLEALDKKAKEKIIETKINADKKEKPPKEKVTPTPSTVTTKSKKKESKPVPEKEEEKPKKLKAPKDKEPKEQKLPKEPKEPKLDRDALKAEKEAEKARKAQEKKEKEEKLKKDKEEKERLKKEKEKQLQAEKEAKQKEKDLLKQQKDTKGKDKQISKEKENSAPKQIDQEDKSKRAEKNEADKKAREEARLQLLRVKSAEANATPEPEKPKVAKKVEQPTTKDLNIKSVINPDNLILQLVKQKQSTTGEKIKPKTLSDLNLTKKEVKTHRGYHKQTKTGACFMCCDSDIELDAESIDMTKQKDEWANIIMGPKIFKYKPPLIVKKNDQNVPLFFQSTFDDAKDPEDKEVVPSPKKMSPVFSAKQAEQDVPKGIIRYALSDRSFIDKGWTMLPTEKVVRKMNVYRMRPAQPQFDWFEHNKNRRLIEYDSGEKLAEFDDNGRGRWFYRNGRMALDYYDAEELNAQQRFVVYSSGEPDERGRAQPYTLLATFDYLGNGIVFDHRGKIRLKYNQTEGVILDRSIGPVSHWKWHTLNDPPVLQQVMIDTQMAHKDPNILKLGGIHDNKARPDNEDMLAIEFDNFIKEKSKKLSQSFKPFQIKMKALKINEHFSLKVLDQATVYLIFRDGTTNLKLNIGMLLDHKEIVDTDTAEVGQVSNNMERLPARTDSLAGLQKNIAQTQLYDRKRTERELRIRPTVPCGSVDKLVSAASRPLRLPLRAVPSGSTTTADYCKCSRKPTANNVYYDTRSC